MYTNYNEGDITKIRSLMVGTKFLCELSKEIKLDQYLTIDNTVVNINKISLSYEKKKKLLFADIFESFIAMLYLEKGEDLLLKILWLTVFNNSITKNKREEFSTNSLQPKLNLAINGKVYTNPALVSGHLNITEKSAKDSGSSCEALNNMD